MIVSQAEVRSRIDQLKLSFEGYKRQLDHLDLSSERKERLQNEVRLLQEEIATLETLAQFGRVELDRDKIEAEVRSRLAHVRQRLLSDPALREYTPEERDMASGELRALQWSLGEDTLSLYTQELLKGHDPDPSRTDRAMPGILVHTLEEGPDTDTRASAAYDIGKLHITQGIPALATALADDPFVAELALQALASFSDDEISAAGLPGDVVAKVRRARNVKHET
jgi:hypothetical protein